MAIAGAFKDVLVAVAIVVGVLGALFLYTGVWPPMVVVESGSMMHVPCGPAGVAAICDEGVGYGKFGTIDPGDMVFVKHAEKREEVATLAEAGAKDPNARNYGKPGDVVVYFPNNQRGRTPIIHRAVAWVEASNVDDPDRCARTEDPGSRAVYSVFWQGRNQTFRANDGGITIEGLGLRGYKPCWSGFITKGDNPVTNAAPDQALGGAALPRQPVQLSWIEGKAVGELPWFGLIKLALGNTLNYPCSPGFRPNDPACDDGRAVRVLNAYAPGDLWAMLGICLAMIAIAPVAYDVYVLKRKPKSDAPPPPPAPPPPAP
ncbi:MAG TPA: S26 family signal peptidase [Candidatus Thermoplasmatota archaeon]|jgi:signal peptidase|nr:S26 family signal peptidase [Candidatus Thermoplasmatota archaeon]